MRVLTFLHSFEAGGVERIALRLVREWRSQGVDAPLFLGRTDGDLRHDVGAGLAFICPRQPPFALDRWEALWMILTLPKVVRAQRPDILFCAGNTYVVVAVALKLILGRRCPPIVAKISNNLDRMDKPAWRRLPYRVWLRFMGRFLDQVVGMAPPMRNEIREALSVSWDKIKIIPDPALSAGLIDRLRAVPPTRHEAGKGRRFVAIGRLAPQKNIALMLRAFGRSHRTGDRLTILGDGLERAKLMALASRLQLGEAVHFRGYVPNPAHLLSEFDILLLSSNYEGVPAVVLEALAARLWIIATDCSRSMAALLEHGMLGQLVPIGDEHALADAIARSRCGLQNGAMSRAQAERFTLEHSSRRYLEVMEALRAHSPEAESGRALTEIAANRQRRSI